MRIFLTILVAIAVVGIYYVLHSYLPVEYFMDNHPVLGPFLVFLGPLVIVGVLLGLVFAMLDTKRRRCPECGDALNDFYIDFENKTVRCPKCGSERNVLSCFDREEFLIMIEAMMARADNEETQKILARFRDEVMPSCRAPRYSGLVLDKTKSRNIGQLLCVLGGGVVGIVVGIALGDLLYIFWCALAGVVGGLSISGIILLIRNPTDYR